MQGKERRLRNHEFEALLINRSSLQSVFAIAVALRSALSIIAISPTMDSAEAVSMIGLGRSDCPATAQFYGAHKAGKGTVSSRAA